MIHIFESWQSQMKCTFRTRSKSELELSSEEDVFHNLSQSSISTPALTSTWPPSSSSSSSLSSNRSFSTTFRSCFPAAADILTVLELPRSLLAVSEWLTKLTHLVRCQLSCMQLGAIMRPHCTAIHSITSHYFCHDHHHEPTSQQQNQDLKTPHQPSSYQNSVLRLVLSCIIVLLLSSLPNQSESLRVPYRYPHYPLFHKEFLQGSSGMFEHKANLQRLI